ncbi:Fungal Zn2-Cys6 binuclear cluster domain-containing protein [Cladophialophora immunda]|nr:Fungal Zn2-Cys6 binuclear cluster domain-containing protein [Cladophialophora immunda]
MNPPDPSPRTPPVKRSSAACIHCSDRKVRCDKQTPCSTCTRHNVQCIFPPPKTKPLRTKRKWVHIDEFDELENRYEALLREKGIDTTDANQIDVTDPLQYGHPSTSSGSDVSRTNGLFTASDLTVSGSQRTFFKPQLLQGQGGTKLVHNLWSRVAQEIHDAEDAFEDDSAASSSDGGSPKDDFTYVLGCNAPATASLHPPSQSIDRLWQIFIENVNPLTKIVHVPSLQFAIEKATNNIEHIPKGFEALMFAIYSIAVLSLTEVECKETFGETRAILLSCYVAATKRALFRAKFMSSTSIVTLQALVLHILSIRDDYEPRAVWSLTGVALRVAEGMGMSLDGTLLGLSPFETEIRRRIWWQLRTHDFRAAELSGQAKFRDFEVNETTPKMPANVDDSDLYPAMSQAAVESTRPTQMIWCMVRSAMATFAAGQTAKIAKLRKVAFTSDEYPAMDDLERKDHFIKGVEDMLETKYLRFCDPSQPLQLMALVGGRTATNLVRFMAHHPRRWAYQDHVSASERQFVWGIATRLLEQYNMMQTDLHLRRFAWHVPYFIQWHAVIHVLDTLRTDPLHLEAQSAWRLIDTLFENNLGVLLSVNRPIVAAVGNLCLKAFTVREDVLKKKQRVPSEPPEYITKLRKQREAAKVRRAEETLASQTRDQLSSQNGLRTADAPFVTQPQQHLLSKQQVSAFPGNARSEDDAFWLSDTLDDGSSADGAVDMMSLYTDAILVQDYSLGTPGNDAIDWERWDTWFGHLDPLRPTIAPQQERRISIQSLVSR